MIKELIEIEKKLKKYNGFLNCEYYKECSQSNDKEELFSFYLNYSFYYVLIKKSLIIARKIYKENQENKLSVLIVGLGKSLSKIDLYYSILLYPLEDYFKTSVMDLTIKDLKKMMKEFDNRIRYSLRLIIENIEYLSNYIKEEEK